MEALGLNINWIVIWAVNFGLLLLILQRIAYRPMRKVLGERTQRIQESLEMADRARREAEETEKAYQRRLEESRREAQEQIARAQEASQKQRQQVLNEARQEARQIVERARREAEDENRRALADLRQQIAGLSLLAAEKVIGDTLDTDRHRQLIQRFLDEELKVEA